MAIEHADFEGIERLAAVLGAEIVSTFDNPEGAKIGKCDLIEEIMIGEDKVMRFSGVQQGQACSLVLRGATEQVTHFIVTINKYYKNNFRSWTKLKEQFMMSSVFFIQQSVRLEQSLVVDAQSH